jgi:hypothetical protein
MATLQPRLFEHLVATGVIDAKGINDRPRPRTCRGCGADTLVAWRDGILDPVAVDLLALTPLGELQALASGRETFQHWGGATGGLDTRRPRIIALHPAGSHPGAPVRPEHRCGSPPLDHIPAPAVTGPTDTPPF